jgi:hypothetical protein
MAAVQHSQSLQQTASLTTSRTAAAAARQQAAAQQERRQHLVRSGNELRAPASARPAEPALASAASAVSRRVGGCAVGAAPRQAAQFRAAPEPARGARERGDAALEAGDAAALGSSGNARGARRRGGARPDSLDGAIGKARCGFWTSTRRAAGTAATSSRPGRASPRPWARACAWPSSTSRRSSRWPSASACARTRRSSCLPTATCTPTRAPATCTACRRSRRPWRAGSRRRSSRAEDRSSASRRPGQARQAAAQRRRSQPRGCTAPSSAAAAHQKCILRCSPVACSLRSTAPSALAAEAAEAAFTEAAATAEAAAAAAQPSPGSAGSRLQQPSQEKQHCRQHSMQAAHQQRQRSSSSSSSRQGSLLACQQQKGTCGCGAAAAAPRQPGCRPGRQAGCAERRRSRPEAHDHQRALARQSRAGCGALAGEAQAMGGPQAPEPGAAGGGPQISDAEAAIYDRQIRLWGKRAQVLGGLAGLRARWRVRWLVGTLARRAPAHWRRPLGPPPLLGRLVGVGAVLGLDGPQTDLPLVRVQPYSQAWRRSGACAAPWSFFVDFAGSMPRQVWR